VYQEQVVISPLGADGCAIDPQLNSSWVIFAVDQIEGSGNRAVIRSVTGLCSGNLPTSTPPGVLGPGQPPLQGASDRGEKAATTDAAITRGLIIGGVAVGILALAVGAALALLWRRQP
jgi:hypothetical protein